jgi:hypothetical protein
VNDIGAAEVEREPYVSVIVPVHNGANFISACIEALLAQTYPKDRYEIIVVDNGSTDDTPEVTQRHPVTLLVEDRVQSPYAARNQGIRHAQGEIIAMIDVSCTPVAEWLERGVQTLESEQADLAGGSVTFTFSREKTLAEMYDSVSNIKMRTSIEKRGVAKTANLFSRRRVFETIGLFPGHLRSGGDVLWTGRATRAGFDLAFAPGAEAVKPARKFVPLLRKQVRVGYGQPSIWQERGASLGQVVKRTIRGLRLPPISFVRHQIRKRGTEEMGRRLIPIWLVACTCAIATNLGRLSYVLNRVFSRER